MRPETASGDGVAADGFVPALPAAHGGRPRVGTDELSRFSPTPGTARLRPTTAPRRPGWRPLPAHGSGLTRCLQGPIGARPAGSTGNGPKEPGRTTPGHGGRLSWQADVVAGGGRLPWPMAADIGRGGCRLLSRGEPARRRVASRAAALGAEPARGPRGCPSGARSGSVSDAIDYGAADAGLGRAWQRPGN